MTCFAPKPVVISITPANIKHHIVKDLYDDVSPGLSISGHRSCESEHPAQFRDLKRIVLFCAWSVVGRTYRARLGVLAPSSTDPAAIKRRWRKPGFLGLVRVQKGEQSKRASQRRPA